MPTPTRRLGNSRGFVISKPHRVEPKIPVEENALLVRASRHSPRGDWAKAGRKIADSDRHKAIWPEFSNQGDADLKC